MTQPELALPIRWGEKGKIQKMLKERPKLPALQVGYHLRNADEALDLLNLLHEVVPEVAYVGLAGGRQAGKVFYSKEKILQKYHDRLPRRIISKIAKTWPDIARNAHGKTHNLIPGIIDSELGVLPANSFIYDVDAIAIPRDFNAESTIHHIVGERSGTHIDLFVVSQANVLRSNHNFYRSIFLNSQKISMANPKIVT